MIVVGASDERGPKALKWETAGSVVEAVEKARKAMGKPDATVTYWRSPPIGYAKVKVAGAEAGAAEAAPAAAAAAPATSGAPA